MTNQKLTDRNLTPREQELFLQACVRSAFEDLEFHGDHEEGAIRFSVPGDEVNPELSGPRVFRASMTAERKAFVEEARSSVLTTTNVAHLVRERIQAHAEEGEEIIGSTVSDNYARFNPETGELTIDISDDHLALTSVALTYVETFSESDGTYTDLGKAVRDYLEEMIDEVRPDYTGEPREEKFRSFCPMLSSDAGDLANKTIEELDDRYREIQSQRENLKDRAFSEEISDEEAIQIRKNVQELGKQLDRIGRWHRCAMLLRATARYSPYAHIIL